MNKKYLSVILFSALMLGTAGTVTSCKDYDDDITHLQEQIDANTAAINEINQLISGGSVITGVTSTDNGVTVTLSNGTSFELTNGTNGTDGTPGSVVTIGENGNWFIDGVDTGNPSRGEKGDKGDQGEPGADGEVSASVYYVPGTEGEEEGYWVKVTEQNGQTTREVTNISWMPAGTLTAVLDGDNLTLGNILINGELGTKVISLGGLLRSMVFIPDLYLDGVEGTRYVYAPGEYITDASTVQTGSDDEGASYRLAADAAWKWTVPASNPEAYVISPIDTVQYHLNPINTNIQNVNWEFLYREPEFIATRAANMPNPVYVSNVQNNGIASIAYKIEDADLLIGAGEDNISVMALQATLSNDSVVTSDYASIVPAVRSLKAIAFTAASGETTTMTCTPELYDDGQKAVENVPTLDVEYTDANGIDLKEILSLHYLQNDFVAATTGTHAEMSYQEAVETYGLEFQYEMMPYQTGNHTTMESQYGKVVDGVFYPCYVDAQGNSVDCTSNPTEGVSAIGRRPVVMVKLVNPADNDKVLLVGYVKIDIVAEIGFKDLLVNEAPYTYAYLCGGFTEETTWSEMSRNVYEELGVTKEVFNATYTVVAGETYEKVNGEMKRVVVSGVNDAYGMLTYTQDNTPGSTNDKITWTANDTQRDLVYAQTGHTKTIYLKFVDNANENSQVYLGLTVIVADKPEVEWGTKIQQYWYPENEALADRDTVRMNVPRPTTAGISSQDVLNYVKDLDDNFVGNKIDYTLTSAAQNTYYSLTGNMAPVVYAYYFAANQPSVVTSAGTIHLTVNTARTQLMDGANVIAEIDPTTGVVTYQQNARAKELLNLFGHADAKPDQLFAEVSVEATYGSCKLALDQRDFNVRFLRPVDVLDNDYGKFIDAQANGSTVKLGDLFDLQDWRDMPLIDRSSTGVYSSHQENGVSLYDYYLFDNIFVDLANAECDLTGSREKLTDVTRALELDVIDGSNNVVSTNIVNISNINNLNTYQIRYMNNGGNVQDFNLWIPVEITYSWGTVKAWAHCTVESTMAN